MTDTYLWKATRPGRYGGVDVLGFKEAPASSVLAGQTLTCFIDNFDTMEEAFSAFPEAEGNCPAPPVSVSHLPDDDDYGFREYEDCDEY